METEGNWVMGTMCECTGNLIVWGGGGGVGWCLVRMNFCPSDKLIVKLCYLTVTDANKSNEYIVVSRLIVHVFQIDSHLQCICLISQITMFVLLSFCHILIRVFI